MIHVENASPYYEGLIVRAISQLPRHFIRAARVAQIIITRKPAEVNEAAQYEHETRNIYLLPSLTPIRLKRSLIHELAHAADDNFGVLHYWGESPHWINLHQTLGAPGVPEVESFAEMMMQYLLNPVRLHRTSPVVARFMAEALAYLDEQFG